MTTKEQLNLECSEKLQQLAAPSSSASISSSAARAGKENVDPVAQRFLKKNFEQEKQANGDTKVVSRHRPSMMSPLKRKRHVRPHNPLSPSPPKLDPKRWKREDYVDLTAEDDGLGSADESSDEPDSDDQAFVVDGEICCPKCGESWAVKLS